MAWWQLVANIDSRPPRQARVCAGFEGVQAGHLAAPGGGCRNPRLCQEKQGELSGGKPAVAQHEAAVGAALFAAAGGTANAPTRVPATKLKPGDTCFLDVFIAASFSLFSGRHPGGRIIPAYLENRNSEGKDDRR